MPYYTQPLELDLGVEIVHPDTTEHGTVIDVFDKDMLINGRWVSVIYYTVQFPSYSSNNTARGWAKKGWKIA
jgi:hypothetical protein